MRRWRDLQKPQTVVKDTTTLSINSLFHCSHPSVWLLLNFDGFIRDAPCHRLTVANVDAGRREIKKRRYEELHSVVASSVGKYHENCDIVKYLRIITNLY